MPRKALTTEPDAEQELIRTDRAASYPGARRQADVRQALVGLPRAATRRETTRRATSASRGACRARSAELWVNMCPAHVYEVGREDAGKVEVDRHAIQLRPVRRDHGEGRTAAAGRGRRRPRVLADVSA